MSSYTLNPIKKYQFSARTVAGVFGVIFLIFFFFKMMTYHDPPIEQSGILVSYGLPEVGQGDKVSAPPAASEEEEIVEEPVEQEEETEPEVAEPEVEEPEVSEPVVEPEKTNPVEKDVLADKRSKEIAIQKAKEKKKRDQEKADAQKKIDAKRKADADAKKKADAEKAAKKAEADKKAAEAAAKKAEADKLKGEIGGLFGESGGGKGNTGTSGNQGDPNGDPNSDNLSGISTGGGKVGGGLGSRGGSGPKITDKSQATGTVVLKVCVDGNGKVLEAKFTQAGSTTSNSQLKRIAIANAMRWTFKKGELDKQCGTITYNFKVK